MKFQTSKQLTHWKQMLAFGFFRMSSFLVLFILFYILGFLIYKGFSVISWEFLTSNPEEGMTKGGIYPAIVGTMYLILGSLLVIVFGLFGMSLFVNTLGFGDSIIAGSLTLGLLTLPIIIRTTEEALIAIDTTFRTSSYALGASKIQTIARVILPMGLPNIITGIILSIGRVSGETAPILFTVAAYFLPKLPSSIYDQVMALPYHLYVIATSGNNVELSKPIAYGTALVLIAIVLIVNILANLIRNYFAKKVKMK